MIKKHEEYIEGASGTRLFYRVWKRDDYGPAGHKYPAASVVIVHGLGEHSGRYEDLGNYLANIGFAVYAPDQKGHGRSYGRRGHVHSFEDFITDLHQIVNIVRTDEFGKKIFLLGHSLGGLIALMYAIKFHEGLSGVIASSPSLKLRVAVPIYKELLGRLLSPVLPALTLDNEIDPSFLSHDLKVVDDYLKDPLVHKRISLGLYNEMLRAMTWTMKHATELAIPSLVLLAEDDWIVDIEGTTRFYKRIRLGDKLIKIYKGHYHENFNEPDKGEVFADVSHWLARRI